MPRMSSWTTTPSLLTSSACAENSSKSIRLLTRSRPCMEWATAGSSEHPPATADRRAHHAGAAVGGLPVRARTRDRIARLAGEIVARQCGHHRQCVVGAAATRVPRSRRYGEVRRQAGGLIRLSASQRALAGWLSRRLGGGGGTRTPADHHGLWRPRAGRVHRPILISLY